MTYSNFSTIFFFFLTKPIRGGYPNLSLPPPNLYLNQSTLFATLHTEYLDKHSIQIKVYEGGSLSGRPEAQWRKKPNNVGTN